MSYVSNNNVFDNYIKERDNKSLYLIYEIKMTLKLIFSKYKVKKVVLYVFYVKELPIVERI